MPNMETPCSMNVIGSQSPKNGLFYFKFFLVMDNYSSVFFLHPVWRTSRMIDEWTDSGVWPWKWMWESNFGGSILSRRRYLSSPWG
jgi:hypothetical protein